MISDKPNWSDNCTCIWLILTNLKVASWDVLPWILVRGRVGEFGEE